MKRLGMLIGLVLVCGIQVSADPVCYSVRMRNGVPQLFENNKPISATGFMYEHPNPDQVKAFGEAGIHLYWLECRQMGWDGPDRHDYQLTDDMLAELFRCDPKARVVLFFYVDLASPLVKPETDWWQDQHPDDLCIDYDGKVFMRYGHKTVSFASEAWRKDAGAAVDRFVKRMEKSPYADRIVGYQPCAGTSYEWMYHGGQDLQFLDYSKPNATRFRQWLRARYGCKVEALRKAWRDNGLTFDTAAIPDPKKRANCSIGNLRDPKNEAPVIDYYTYLSDLTAGTADYFCEIIKRASQGRKTAGLFYGYVLEQFYGGYCTQHTGHFALDKVLRSKNVDFLMAPTSYWGREPGGAGGYMSAIGSIRLNGKLWINQADYRTHLAKESDLARCVTEDQTIGVLRREFAMDLSAGVPVYWYSFSYPWLAPSEPVMTNIRRMNRIEEEVDNLKRDHDGNGLAVIVSNSPAAYTGLEINPMRSLVYLQRDALYRSGIKFDVYLDSDLENPNMPRYKAYLFLGSVHLKKSCRKWIDEHLKKDHRVIAWVWAPGAVDNNKVSTDNISSLCGIRLAMSTDTGIASVQPNQGYGPEYGSDSQFSPVFYPDDPSVEVIGKLTSPKSLVGKPGICIKRYPEWTSVYSAAPRLSPEMIRTIARLAGVHVYSDSNDPIYISSGYIGIHAKDAGNRRIVLPQADTVVDCFTDRVIGTNISEFTVSQDSFSTGIYKIGNK